MSEPTDLTYIGGDQHLIGVPARDLTADEIEAAGWKPKDLLASGLYVEAKPKKETKPSKA